MMHEGCLAARQWTGGELGQRPVHPAERLPQQAEAGPGVPKRLSRLTCRRTRHLSAVRPQGRRAVFGACPAQHPPRVKIPVASIVSEWGRR